MASLITPFWRLIRFEFRGRGFIRPNNGTFRISRQDPAKRRAELGLLHVRLARNRKGGTLNRQSTPVRLGPRPSTPDERLPTQPPKQITRRELWPGRSTRRHLSD